MNAHIDPEAMIEIDVWRIPLTSEPSEHDKLLDPDERRRAARFIFDSDRARFTRSRGTLRATLARYVDILPEQIKFDYGTHGKPTIRGCPIHFNLSHAGDWAYLAISTTTPVGIDVERLRPPARNGWIDLARRFFSKTEVTELLALPSSEQTKAFFACWTRKEAYIKLHGRGLSLPLGQFTVAADPKAPAILRSSEWCPDDTARTVLHDLSSPAGYRACLAVGTPLTITVQSKTWTAPVTLT